MKDISGVGGQSLTGYKEKRFSLLRQPSIGTGLEKPLVSVLGSFQETAGFSLEYSADVVMS